MKKSIGFAMLAIACIFPSAYGGNDRMESQPFPWKQEMTILVAAGGRVTLQNSYQCGSGATSVSVTVQNYASPYQTYTLTAPGNASQELPFGYYKIVTAEASCGGTPVTDVKIYEVTTGTSSSFTVTESRPSVYIIVGNE